MSSSEYRIIQQPGYLRIELEPTISIGGMQLAYRDVAEHDRVSAQPRLWLLPATLSDEFEFDRMMSLVPPDLRQGVDGKAAFVAVNDLPFAKATQATRIRPENPSRFAVFRDETSALAWLGVSAAD